MRYIFDSFVKDYVVTIEDAYHVKYEYEGK